MILFLLVPILLLVVVLCATKLASDADEQMDEWYAEEVQKRRKDTA